MAGRPAVLGAGPRGLWLTFGVADARKPFTGNDRRFKVGGEGVERPSGDLNGRLSLGPVHLAATLSLFCFQALDA